eukprot:1590841-Pyramimonas_sp.AAC.1
MIRRRPRSTRGVSSAASDVYKRQVVLQSHSHTVTQWHSDSGGRSPKMPMIVELSSSPSDGAGGKPNSSGSP